MPADLYAISRASKLKALVPTSAMSENKTGPQLIGDSEAHELRLENVPNADPERWRLNRLLIDGQDLTFTEAKDQGYLKRGLFRERVLEAAAKKSISPADIPKDAVLLQQILLTASPEYFTRCEKGGTLEVKLDEKYSAWRLATKKFVEGRYGANLLFMVEHLDEVTPHISAFVVPLVLKADKPRGRWGVGRPEHPPLWRFAAADLFGRKQLFELWTAYAKANESIGSVRPPNGARVSYETMGRVYAAVSRANDRAESTELLAGITLPPPKAGLIPELASSYIERVSPVIKQAVAEANKVVKDLCLETSDAKRNRDRVKELRKKLRAEEEEKKRLREELRKENEARLLLHTQQRDVACIDLFKALRIDAEVRNSVFHARTHDGRAITFKWRDFEVRDRSGTIQTGTGAIEFLQKLFGLTIQQAEELCIGLVGAPAVGAITSRLLRTLSGSQPDPQIATEFSKRLRTATQKATKVIPQEIRSTKLDRPGPTGFTRQ